jgi:hypothetical protein
MFYTNKGIKVRGIFEEIRSPLLKQSISHLKHDCVIHILINKLEKD